MARDTIAAIATAPGRGGLGTVRMSGPQARPIAERLLQRALQPRRAHLAQFRDGDGAVLDQVIAVWFAAPASATAEDVVEITAHGAPVLLDAILRATLAAGARLAEPGEFTRRGFLNGRLDLTQAEAIGDLVAAHTLHQAREAARQMQGSVAHLLRPLHQRYTVLIAHLEAGIDFADDDVTVVADAQLHADIAALRQELARLQCDFQLARVVREGLTVALVGRPNVGKSSLFNRLLARERAIVTAQPGTTRDLIEASVDWDGIPVRLVDTAGIRPPEGEAERLGIARSWEAAADADLVLAVFDASEPLQPEDRELQQHWLSLPCAVAVWNKADLGLAAPGAEGGVVVSALTGAGIAELRAALRRRVLPEAAAEGEHITNLRHAAQLALADQHLARAAAAAGHVPHEALLVDLYDGLHALDAITGQTTVEDILGVIFSTFCIGK
ncbi:MAG: tRNA uridine-5-carboxymethylaminomethyl(34) synthesis GTPase MnmE [Terriglobales bacterium]